MKKAATKKAPRKKTPRKKTAEPAKIGRPRLIQDEQIEQAFSLMAEEGVSLKAACQAVGITYSSTRDRIYSDQRLSALHARAREGYLDSRVQEMNEIALTEPDVQRARLMCDNIKWEAARILRKKYGDRLEIDQTVRTVKSMTDEELEREIAAEIDRRISAGRADSGSAGGKSPPAGSRTH